MKGVRLIASDDHSGLKAARQAVLPGVPWQRCQFHLAHNAIHHAPTVAIRQRIGTELRTIWNATKLPEAQQHLKQLVDEYRSPEPDLAKWLERNVIEGLTVLAMPDGHRRTLRTINGIERPVQQELKRRIRKVRIFPNTDALLRLVSAILVEIDEKWTTDEKRYIVWEPIPS